VSCGLTGSDSKRLGPTPVWGSFGGSRVAPPSPLSGSSKAPRHNPRRGWSVNLTTHRFRSRVIVFTLERCTMSAWDAGERMRLL